MMKEVALFAVASSALVYFLSPTAEKPAAMPEEIMEEIQPVKAPVESADDSWGYEDEDEDEGFVFGEPIKLQDEDFDSENIAEAQNAEGQTKLDNSTKVAGSQNGKTADADIGSVKERERRTRNIPPLREVL